MTYDSVQVSGSPVLKNTIWIRKLLPKFNNRPIPTSPFMIVNNGLMYVAKNTVRLE